MASQDLNSVIKVVPAIPPQLITGPASVQSAIIDTVDYESLTFVLLSATITTGDFTFTLDHGNEPDLSDAQPVQAPESQGSELFGVSPLFGAPESNAVRRLGYRGDKRYVRATIVGNPTGVGTLGCVAIQGHPRIAPVDPV